MNKKIPHSPFTTRLSGSAKETELRLRNIFQWKKKRPPVVLFVLTAALLLLCCGLVGFTAVTPKEPPVDDPITETTPPANDPAPKDTDTTSELAVTPQTATDTNNIPDLGLPNVIELSTSDGKTYSAQRYDGDGWYIYIPEGWYKENVWDRWNSQYGTGAYLNVQHCSDRTEDIKAYYGVLGAWPYDTDMKSPYDYYYLLTPSARHTLRQELFFVPVSETSSYVLTCIWVNASQRDGEYDLLHAMAASFTVDERITRAPVAENSLAVQNILNNLTWDNTTTLTRDNGDAMYEMPLNGEFFELLRMASNNLHPIDQPDEFTTLPGSVTLGLSNDSNGHISFFAGENHPSVLVRYVTDTMNEAVVVEDFALYTFLLASSEHKYLELHDLDDDTICETVVWSSENNKRYIVIYDFYYSEPQRISVNEALGCIASEYTGQIANIKNEYSNLIKATTADESLLYSYSNGQFTYVCTLDEALRK